VKDFCERRVVCRPGKIQPHAAVTLYYPLLVPPRPWQVASLDHLTHLLVSNGFDIVLIVVDHLSRMAHFLSYTESVTTKETTNLLLQGVYRLHELLTRVLVSDCDRNSSVAYGRRFGDA
jgi:hypothetical protein